MTTFPQLGLSDEILKVLEELKFSTPTEIQAQAIPQLLSAKTDLIGLAQTGTGKTAAFGLPILDLVDVKVKNTQALILSPTRELGLQIASELDNFSKYKKGLKIIPVYGGASIVNQIKDIKRNNPHIIVATPGRLIDLIDRKVINLANINNIILDEADEMLKMGFKDDIDKILSFTSSEKNTWLFSATMPKDIRKIVKNYMHNPVEVAVTSGQETNKNIEHQYALMKESDKTEGLRRIFESTPDLFGVIFCRTKRDTQSLAEQLSKFNFKVEPLHGDLSQAQREAVMKKFRKRAIQAVVATDVAARGIDVDDISHVIHHSLPDDMEFYTHRSGRTARAGKSGLSIALISSRDISKIRALERNLDMKFSQFKVPTLEEINKGRIVNWAADLHKANETSADQSLVDTLNEIFEGVSKEDLLKKLVAQNFGTKTTASKNADINLDLSDVKKMRDSGGRDRKRNDRRDRRSKNFDSRGGVKFFINVGKMDRMDKPTLVRLISEKLSLSGRDIDDVVLLEKHSYFRVDESLSGKVDGGFKDAKIKGRKIRVNRAN